MGIMNAAQVKFVWPSYISTEKLPVVEATLRRLSDNIIKHKLGWAQSADRDANYQHRFHLIMSPLPTYPAACLTYLHEEGHALSPRQHHHELRGLSRTAWDAFHAQKPVAVWADEVDAWDWAFTAYKKMGGELTDSLVLHCVCALSTYFDVVKDKVGEARSIYLSFLEKHGLIGKGVCGIKGLYSPLTPEKIERLKKKNKEQPIWRRSKNGKRVY